MQEAPLMPKATAVWLVENTALSFDQVAEFCKRLGILSGRWAEMDEVGSAVVYLASDRARYITGTRLFIDGGFSVNARPA